MQKAISLWGELLRESHTLVENIQNAQVVSTVVELSGRLQISVGADQKVKQFSFPVMSITLIYDIRLDYSVLFLYYNTMQYYFIRKLSGRNLNTVVIVTGNQ